MGWGRQRKEVVLGPAGQDRGWTEGWVVQGVETDDDVKEIRGQISAL